MKKIRRLAVMLSMVLMVQLLTVPQAAYAAQTRETQAETDETNEAETQETNDGLTTDNFRVRAVPGLDGYYKSGIPVPITIYLESLTEDFEGIIRLIVPGDGHSLNASAYEKNITLTAGSEKVISMSVNNSYSMSAYKLQLEDTSGKIVLEYDITTKSQTGENVLVGILSDDFTALNYFDGKTLNLGSYTTTSQVVELNGDTFPDQASGLEALGYLIINSFDTSSLNENQYHALKSWVEGGGILMIGTGSDYKQTLSGFQDEFIEGGIEAFQSGDLSLISGSDTVSFSEQDGIVTLSPETGKALDGVLSAPELIRTQEYGQGHVIITAFNLGMEPVSSWAAKDEMASLLLSACASGHSAQRIENLNRGNSVDTWSLTNVLNGLPEVAKPNMPLLIILFVVFVFFAGPGLYLILKAADKREWMWGIVPALSVVVMAGVFLLSRDMRISAPTESSVTALFYDSERDASSQKAYIGIRVPGAAQEQITLQSSLTNLQPMQSYSDYSLFDSYTGSGDSYAYKTAMRELPDGYLLTIQNGSTFESSYMSADVASTGSEAYGLEAEITRSISGMQGTVTNNTGFDLAGVSVYTDNRMVLIGNLKSGESVSFDEGDNESFSAGYVDFYSYNMPGIDDPDLQEDFANVWNLFCNEYLYSMKAGAAYTFAWLPEYEADYAADDNVAEANTAMLIRCDPASYTDYPDAKSLSLFQYTVGSPQNWDTDGWMYEQEVEVSFDISTELTQIYALSRAEDDASVWGNSSNVSIYGYNCLTGEYDELFADGLVMEFPDGCPYISENGVIQMKFITSTPDDVDYAPAITVIGGGN